MEGGMDGWIHGCERENNGEQDGIMDTTIDILMNR
jgi:hypothetical protein